FFQLDVPFQRFAQDVRGLTTLGAGALAVVVQLVAVGRVHAVVDDHAGALARCQATQIGQALLGHHDIHVVLGVVHVGHHRHDGGNLAVLGRGLGDENGQRVAGEIAGATDAVHHLGAGHVGGVHV